MPSYSTVPAVFVVNVIQFGCSKCMCKIDFCIVTYTYANVHIIQYFIHNSPFSFFKIISVFKSQGFSVTVNYKSFKNKIKEIKACCHNMGRVVTTGPATKLLITSFHAAFYTSPLDISLAVPKSMQLTINIMNKCFHLYYLCIIYLGLFSTFFLNSKAIMKHQHTQNRNI